MLKKLLNYKTPSVEVNGDSLVLSLDDAITPAVWVIKMKDEDSFLIKVEEAENNLFALRKISFLDKGSKEETLGFYREKQKAFRTMNMATKALNTKAGARASFIGKTWNLFKTIVTTLVLLYLVFFTKIDNTSLLQTVTPSGNAKQTVAEKSQFQPSNNPDEIGVPLSADDFLNTKPKPFSIF